MVALCSLKSETETSINKEVMPFDCKIRVSGIVSREKLN
jgi:hypothetical protein